MAFIDTTRGGGEPHRPRKTLADLPGMSAREILAELTPKQVAGLRSALTGQPQRLGSLRLGRQGRA